MECLPSESSHQLPAMFYATSSKFEEVSIPSIIQREIRIRQSICYSNRIPNEQIIRELEELLFLRSTMDPSLKEFVIDYLAIKEVSELVSPKLSTYVTPTFFLKFPRTPTGNVSLSSFICVVREKTKLTKKICMLNAFNLSTNYIKEVQLEEFISNFLLPLNLEPELNLFYMHSSVRRIMFFLDPLRTGKVSIPKFLTFDSLLSYDSFMKLYTTYLDIDTDGNGMLTKQELAKYPTAILNFAIIDRIFEEHETFQSEMDFKGYLDFVFVLENPTHPTSIRYVWKLLDTKRCGRIGFQEFLPFHTCILKTQPASSCVHAIHLFHETLDVLQIRDRAIVTISDLLSASSNAVSAVMSMLLDAHAFYLYDNRESILTVQEPNTSD